MIAKYASDRSDDASIFTESRYVVFPCENLMTLESTGGPSKALNIKSNDVDIIDYISISRERRT